MSNPARALHALYVEWRERAAAGNESQVNLLQPHTMEGAVKVGQAMRLLLRIDDLLQQFEADGAPVGLYRRQFPQWSAGLLSTSAGWGSPLGPDHVVTELVLDQIEGFGNYLDGKVYEVEADQMANLRSVLASARSLLEADTSIDEQLSLYVHRLLQEIEHALDDAAVGVGYDFGEGAQRLWVAFRAAESTSKRRGDWANLAKQIVVGAVSLAVVEGSKALIAITTGTAVG